MKSHTLFIPLILAGLAAQPVLADDAHHPEKKAGADASAPAPISNQAIQQMQANTKKMQAQLEKMAKSKDPKERQQLMQEHMKAMQENAAMGQRMMMGKDCPMMGAGMGSGMGMGMMGKGGMGPEAMMERMQKMEQHMEKMEKMMEQMSKGQAAAAPAGK